MAYKKIMDRLNLIIKKIKSKPSTFEEIKDYLNYHSERQGFELEEYYPISKKTFGRDIIDIQDITGITIFYNRKISAYEIENTGDIENRILESYETLNVLNYAQKLPVFLHFDKRKVFQSHDLIPFLDAIKNQHFVSFVYEVFLKSEVKNRIVKPYGLKEFKNRWYLLAEEKSIIKSFALDRISKFKETQQLFDRNPDFNIEMMYKDCFGIFTGSHAEEVILSLSPQNAKFLASLPLHSSQKIIFESETEVQFSLFVQITYDFEQELLAFGSHMKIMQPKSLAETIKNEHYKAYLKYIE